MEPLAVLRQSGGEGVAPSGEPYSSGRTNSAGSRSGGPSPAKATTRPPSIAAHDGHLVDACLRRVERRPRRPLHDESVILDVAGIGMDLQFDPRRAEMPVDVPGAPGRDDHYLPALGANPGQFRGKVGVEVLVSGQLDQGVLTGRGRGEVFARASKWVISPARYCSQKFGVPGGSNRSMTSW